MAKDIDFSGPYLKTERAEQHIRQLEDIFRRWQRQNRQNLRPHRYRDRRKSREIGGAFPRHTPTVLGDALHNLRAALDHAYCVLIKANGGNVAAGDYVNFPIHAGGTRDALHGAVNGHIKARGGPSEAIRDCIVDEIQPYASGNGTQLCGLHKLDITDKHIVLLPIGQTTLVEDIAFEDGGGIRAIGLQTSNAAAITLEPGVSLKKGQQHKVAFEICFGDGQPFEGQPILPILKDIAASVQRALRLLEQRAKETA